MSAARVLEVGCIKTADLPTMKKYSDERLF